MTKVYFISSRDAGVACDFEARGSSLDDVMQLCADHGAREHNMKGFGPELYGKMRSCVRRHLRAGQVRRSGADEGIRHAPVASYVALSSDES